MGLLFSIKGTPLSYKVTVVVTTDIDIQRACYIDPHVPHGLYFCDCVQLHTCTTDISDCAKTRTRGDVFPGIR